MALLHVDCRGPMKPALVLAVILLFAVLIRVRLIVSGGQFYWPDETRYEDSRDLVTTVARGDVTGALRTLNKAEHLLFRIIGVIPAAIERVAGQNPRIPAFLFSLGSVASIGLLWTLARRLGADDGEALLATGLLALSSTFFYYSRHLVPYDVAMALGLLAILVGAGPDPSRTRSASCGLIACMSVLTYEGYWALGGIAVLIHILGATGGGDSVARRALLALCGLMTPPLVAIGISAALGGNLFASFLEFSQSVSQGSMAEGWRLPFEYLWHAEHLLLLVWIVALASCAWHTWRGDNSRLVRVGLIGAFGIYGALVLSSTALHLFVVYGRTARQLVPFLCLIAAHEIARLRTAELRAKGVLVGAIVVLMIAQAAVNFRQPLGQMFPIEFRERAQGLVQGDADRYRFVNAEHIYPRPRVQPSGPYVTLAQARHPLEFLPYQYEGFDPEERSTLRASDLTMRLVMSGTRN